MNNMYSGGFVMAVLVDGKPVSEKANGQVDIPYGEYALRFRNKHKDRRAVVKLTIDGEDVSGGGGYVIPASGFVDIERHFDSPHKFLFVDLDSPEAVDAGKNGANLDKQKGVIAASFYLEKKPDPVTQVIHEHHYHPPVVWPEPWYPRPPRPYRPYPHPMFLGQIGNAVDGANSRSMNCSLGGTPMMAGKPEPQAVFGSCDPVNDGCTVEGSHSNQQFHQQYIQYEDTPTVLRIFLQGYVKPAEVAHERPGKRKVEKDNAQKLGLLEEQIEDMRKELEWLRSSAVS